VVPSDPEAIAAFIESLSSNVAGVGLEAGATSTWLWTELNKLGLPVICIDARHAKAAPKMRINKSMFGVSVQGTLACIPCSLEQIPVLPQGTL
jgi:transposase